MTSEDVVYHALSALGLDVSLPVSLSLVARSRVLVLTPEVSTSPFPTMVEPGVFGTTPVRTPHSDLFPAIGRQWPAGHNSEGCFQTPTLQVPSTSKACRPVQVVGRPVTADFNPSVSPSSCSTTTAASASVTYGQPASGYYQTPQQVLLQSTPLTDPATAHTFSSGGTGSSSESSGLTLFSAAFAASRFALDGEELDTADDSRDTDVVSPVAAPRPASTSSSQAVSPFGAGSDGAVGIDALEISGDSKLVSELRCTVMEINNSFQTSSPGLLKRLNVLLGYINRATFGRQQAPAAQGMAKLI
jgi:hypothetical protein